MHNLRRSNTYSRLAQCARYDFVHLRSMISLLVKSLLIDKTPFVKETCSNKFKSTTTTYLYPTILCDTIKLFDYFISIFLVYYLLLNH